MSTSQLKEKDGVQDGQTTTSVKDGSIEQIEHQVPPPLQRIDSHLDETRVKLGWRSWMVVFVTCFACVEAPPIDSR